MKKRYCKCGCGMELPIRKDKKQSARFIRGHWNKLKILKATHNEIKYCECGCGQKLKWKNSYRREGWPKFIHGHQNRIRIGKTNKEIYNDDKKVEELHIKARCMPKNKKLNREEKLKLFNSKVKIYNKFLNGELKHKAIDRKIKRETELNYKITEILRARIGKAVKRKSDSTKALLGCSINELQVHLEKRFKDNMSWKNYGLKGWHIDHIVPCIKFDLTKKEEQKKCFHYTNLQPLWAKDNLSKSGKSPQSLYTK